MIEVIKMERSLKEIALELLLRYRAVEIKMIWECSCTIKDDLKNLEEECKAYEKLIRSF